MKSLSLVCILFIYAPVFAQGPVYQAFEADSAAQPRGGLLYLNGFLQSNLRKPVKLESQGIGGQAVVTGIVEPNGRITDVKAIPGKFPKLDREAVRVFSRFNAWQPALKGGKAIRQQVTIPVIFESNAPFLYVDGTRVSYFDADKNPLADSSDKARYMQVAPVDTNGLPNGDIVVYKGKGANWEERYRSPLIRIQSRPRTPVDRAIYKIGYQAKDQKWQGNVSNVFSVDDTGALVSQYHYDNNLAKGFSLTYYPNGIVDTWTNEVDGQKTMTSWYPNGQIKQVLLVQKKNLALTNIPPKTMALWDSTGNQFVRDGNGRVVHQEMTKSYNDTTQQTTYIEQGLYANGFKQGIWTGHYTDGSYFYEEQYENGVCQNGKAHTAGSDTVRYTVPVQQPKFPGGTKGLGQFLSQNLRYPSVAKRAKVQGQVFVSFIVCTDGTLCDYEILQSVDPSVDNEALRVVKAMSGLWKPGVQRGQKVRVQYNLPINFTLQ